MNRVLLTGFDPFDGAELNPSWEAIRLVEFAWDRPEELVTRRLPVTFGSAGRRLTEHVAMHTPDAVVAVGVAAGRAAITPERVAINVRDARIPDNVGRQPHESPSIAGAPAAYFSTLPIAAITEAINRFGVQAEVSNSAGTFVCNDAFFALQHALTGLQVASGFIHVPATPEMGLGASVPTMSLTEIARGLRIALDTILDDAGDPA